MSECVECFGKIPNTKGGFCLACAHKYAEQESKEAVKQELKELRLLCSALDDTSIYRIDDIRIYINKRLAELEGKGK